MSSAPQSFVQMWWLNKATEARVTSAMKRRLMFRQAKQFHMRQVQENCVDSISWQSKKGLATKKLIRNRWLFQQLYEFSPSCVAVVRSTNPEEGVRNTEVDEGISLRAIDLA